jgi:hypothetical protein
VFLGQKYGYRPIPTYILGSELDKIRESLASLSIDGSLLDKWYRKDSNAVPCVYILQPISSILVNFNNKVLYCPCFLWPFYSFDLYRSVKLSKSLLPAVSNVENKI